MRFFSSSLSVCILAGAVTAQVGPGITRAAAKSTVFTAPNGSVPGTDVRQIAFQRLPGDTPGTWTVTLTANAVPASFGGQSGSGVLEGSYSRITGKFTPNKNAATLNAQGNDFALNYDPSGKYTVVDHSDGVYFAHRAKPGVAFGAAVKVLGMGTIITPTYVDPALCYVGGTTVNDLHMLWISSNGIVVQKLDISNLNSPTVTGTAKSVVVSAVSGTAHSPFPIHGPDGTLKGIYHADVTGSDSDMMWADDLDPNTPSEVVHNTTGWLNNGGIAGSLIAWADSTAPYHIVEAQGTWLLGDNKPIGQQASIFGAGPRGRVPGVTAIFASAKTMAPITIPGFKGQFALDLGTLVPFGSMAHVSNDETGQVSFGIPNLKGLSGLKLALQGLYVDSSSSTLAFTNTAKLVIQ